MLKNVEIQTKKELSWRRQYRDFPVTLGFRARTLMGEAFSMALPVGQIHYLLGLLVLDAGWRQFPPVSTPA